MPYDLDWIDEELRILSIRLFDPLDTHDIEEFRQTITPIVEAPHPLFLLVNIGELDFRQAFSTIVTALEGEPLPDIAHHVNGSRLAVVGGGAPVTLILALVGQSESVHAFAHEDQALTWLRKQAQQATNTSP